MNRERRLSDRITYITGAASGLGYATALRFAEEGAIVIGSDLRECAQWSAIAERSPKAEFHIVDVRDPEGQQAVVDGIVARHGRLDVLVTAAGVAGGGPVHMISVDEWQRVQDINLKGTFLSAKAVLPQMIKQRSGSIITVASVEGLEGCEGGSTYNASKGGVVLLTKNLANDYGRVGIRANSICPGFIDTPMFQSVYGSEHIAEVRELVREQHKLDRFGLASEIAGAAFFLASDDSSFVTGVALPVDGGYTAGHSHGLAAMMGLI